jgi:hypothetical protein
MVSTQFIWHFMAILFWRQQWTCIYSNCLALCDHAEWISSARTMLMPQWYTLIMVSASWRDISHGTYPHTNSSRNVSRMCHLEKWRRLASTLARFIPMWLLPLWIFKAQGLWESTSPFMSCRSPSGLPFQWTCWGTQQTLSGDVQRINCRTVELIWLMLSLKSSYHMACFSTDFINMCFLYYLKINCHFTNVNHLMYSAAPCIYCDRMS